MTENPHVHITEQFLIEADTVAEFHEWLDSTGYQEIEVCTLGICPQCYTSFDAPLLSECPVCGLDSDHACLEPLSMY